MAPNIGGCIYTAAGPSASPPEVEGIRPGLRHGLLCHEGRYC